jgi:transcriptional regulator with AAA-type ATPase domain
MAANDTDPTAIVAESPQMKKVLERARDAAATNASVLITGESGSGKEVVANVIHDMSDRGNKPFLAFNTAAIAETLIEAELFGHERGAFTGAVTQRQGYFELVKDGTIFLDEIGDMPKTSQVKLLRVLEERRFRRVGGNQQVPFAARLIAATHRDLVNEIQDGRFREDLYYRLNEFPIVIPPLRERREDIEPLVQRFIARACKELQVVPKTISTAALARLERQMWRGNARELKNVIIGTIATHRSVLEIESAHLDDAIRQTELQSATTQQRYPTEEPQRERPRPRKGGPWAKVAWDEQIPALLAMLIVFRQTEGSERSRLDRAHELSNYMSRAVLLETRTKRAGGETGPEIVRRVLSKWRTLPHRPFSPLFSTASTEGRGFREQFGADAYDYERTTREFAPELKKFNVWLDPGESHPRPLLGWMKQLTSIADEGKCVFAPVVAGNGAEEITAILRESVFDATVRQFDLGPVDGDFMAMLRNAAGSEDSNPCRVAAVLAGSAKRLVLVVNGWGLHTKQRGVESVGEIWQGIKRLRNCPTPGIIIVAVSAVPFTHYVSSALAGSMMGFMNTLVFSTQDDRILSEWALNQLRETPGDVEGLLRLAGAQLGAVRAAVHAAGSPSEDLTALIRYEHERSGNAIYADLPECCQGALNEVIRGNAGRADCVTVLKGAGILVDRGGRNVPRVTEWTSVFRMAEGRS